MLHRNLRPEYGHRSFVLASLSMLGGIAALGGLRLNTGDAGTGGSSGGGAGDGGSGPGAGDKPEWAKKIEQSISAAGAGDPPSQPFRSFASQKDFDDEAAKIRRNAEKDAVKKLADDLGMTIDEAKALIADRKAAEDAKLSEVEKREKAATAAAQAAADQTAQATKLMREATIALALAGAKVNTERLVYAQDAVVRELGDNEATTENVEAAVKAVSEKVPEFFGEALPTQKPPALTTPGGPRSSASGNSTPMERGRERAKALRGTSNGTQNDPFAALGRAVGS